MAEENSNYKFTILGETGSGKTCYLLGMYYEMAMGVAGYNLVTETPEEDQNLSRRYELLKDKSRGQSRFPSGTDSMDKYTFYLQYSYEDILPFDWIDYPGGWLDAKVKDVNSPLIQELNKNIQESSALFICIDGANLLGNNTNKKIRAVKTKCARNISPYLGKFKGNLPPIVMLVTKYDMCEADTDADEIREIIEEAFESLFERNDIFVSVIPVSLGATLEDDDYSGDLDPINVHLPILMGIDFALVDTLHFGKSVIESDKGLYNNVKKDREDEENSFFLYRWIFGKDTNQMRQYENEIQENIERNKKICGYFKKSLKKINRDLADVEMVFANGSWQDKRGIAQMWNNLHSIVNYF